MSVATKTPLPDDLAAAHRLIREQQLMIERMQSQLEQLLRQRFGSNREIHHPDQLLLFGEEAVPLPPAPPETESNARPGHGRRKLPAGLPRREIVHDLTPEQKVCPECGVERIRIGEASSEQLEYVRSRWAARRGCARSGEHAPIEPAVGTVAGSMEGKPISRGDRRRS